MDGCVRECSVNECVRERSVDIIIGSTLWIDLL